MDKKDQFPPPPLNNEFSARTQQAAQTLLTRQEQQGTGSKKGLINLPWQHLLQFMSIEDASRARLATTSKTMHKTLIGLVATNPDLIEMDFRTAARMQDYAQFQAFIQANQRALSHALEFSIVENPTFFESAHGMEILVGLVLNSSPKNPLRSLTLDLYDPFFDSARSFHDVAVVELEPPNRRKLAKALEQVPNLRHLELGQNLHPSTSRELLWADKDREEVDPVPLWLKTLESLDVANLGDNLLPLGWSSIPENRQKLSFARLHTLRLRNYTVAEDFSQFWTILSECVPVLHSLTIRQWGFRAETLDDLVPFVKWIQSRHGQLQEFLVDDHHTRQSALGNLGDVDRGQEVLNDWFRNRAPSHRAAFVTTLARVFCDAKKDPRHTADEVQDPESLQTLARSLTAELKKDHPGRVWEQFMEEHGHQDEGVIPWEVELDKFKILVVHILAMRQIWAQVVAAATGPSFRRLVLSLPLVPIPYLSPEDDKTPYCLAALVRAAPNLQVLGTGIQPALTRSFLTCLAKDARHLQALSIPVASRYGESKALIQEAFQRHALVQFPYNWLVSPSLQWFEVVLDRDVLDTKTLSHSLLQMPRLKGLEMGMVDLRIQHEKEREWPRMPCQDEVWNAVATLRHLVVLDATVWGQCTAEALTRIATQCTRLEHFRLALIDRIGFEPKSSLGVSTKIAQLFFQSCPRLRTWDLAPSATWFAIQKEAGSYAEDRQRATPLTIPPHLLPDNPTTLAEQIAPSYWLRTRLLIRYRPTSINRDFAAFSNSESLLSTVHPWQALRMRRREALDMRFTEFLLGP